MSLSSFFIMNIFFDSRGIAVRASGGLRSRPSQPVCVPGPQGDLWRLTPYLGSQNSSWSAASLTASEVWIRQSKGSPESCDKTWLVRMGTLERIHGQVFFFLSFSTHLLTRLPSLPINWPHVVVGGGDAPLGWWDSRSLAKKPLGCTRASGVLAPWEIVSLH